MVDLTRRSFLGGLLAVTAVAIINPPKLHSYPVLYADGKRDDAPALQAMLDGKPYIVEGELIKSTKQFKISGGDYRVNKSLHIYNDLSVIENANFDFHGSEAVFIIHEGVKGGLIQKCYINCNGADHAIKVLGDYELKFKNVRM